MNSNILILEKASVFSPSRKTPILFPAALKIKTGKIVSVIGSSGSGKTTFLKLIMGLLLPGHGWLAGGTIKKLPGLKIGWVAQNPSLQLFKNFVIEEFFPMPKEETEFFLSEFDLKHLAGKRCCELSQGEKSVIVFARALSKKVGLLILDEVMVNLAASRRAWLKKCLRDYASSGGSVVSVEHTADILDISDEVIHINEGRLGFIDKKKAEEILTVDFSDLPSIENTGNFPGEGLTVSNIYDDNIRAPGKSGLNFNVKKGEFAGITGDNGSGKTTLLNIIAGLKKPESGGIFFNGKKLNGLGSRRGLISFVGHEPLTQLFADTAEDEFEFTSLSKNSADTVKLLSDFNLNDLRKRQVHTLSYGEQQRLVLAANLAGGTDILLFDEPTYGMDRLNMRKFIEILLNEKRKGKTIIMASHDGELLNHLADRVISV